MPMTWLLLLALALFPCVGFIVFIYLRDWHEREPIYLLFITFLFGCLTVVPPLLLQSLVQSFQLIPFYGVYSTFINAFIVVAFTEEGAKLLFLRAYAYPKKEFNEPFDGIVYAVMIAMGFAAVENVWYVLAEPDFDNAIYVGFLRIFTAVPAHATFAIIMGYFLGEAKFETNTSRQNFLKLQALVFPVFLHGCYDFFLMQKINYALALGALFSLLLSIYLARKSIRSHSHNSPFRIPEPDILIEVNDPGPTWPDDDKA